jgi:hypothetical protein
MRERHQASKSIVASQGIVNTHEVLSKIPASKGKPSTIQRETLSNEEISASQGIVNTFELVLKTLTSKLSRSPLREGD